MTIYVIKKYSIVQTFQMKGAIGDKIGATSVLPVLPNFVKNNSREKYGVMWC